MSNIPGSCEGVKCMQSGCKNQAMHKVGEENLYNPFIDKEKYDQFNMRHNLTTYLCEDHFQKLMTREEYYGDISKYK